MTTRKAGEAKTLEDLIGLKIQEYFENMKGEKIDGLYSLILGMVERPLIALTLEKTGNNKAKAAGILGIHRNTLLKKISELKITVKKADTPRRRPRG